MEVWNEHIMDIGLTVAGYLTAAGLGMLIHSAWVGRRRRAVAPAMAPNETVAAAGADAVSGPHYIELRSPRSTRSAASPVTVTRPVRGPEGRRDRVEMIRVARQMLAAGAPADRVRRTLPISDAELALLQSINGN